MCRHRDWEVLYQRYETLVRPAKMTSWDEDVLLACFLGGLTTTAQRCGKCGKVEFAQTPGDARAPVSDKPASEESWHIGGYRRHEGPRAQCDWCAVVGEVDP